VSQLGGVFEIGAREGRGVCLSADIPLAVES
jgi:hypothetical protein